MIRFNFIASGYINGEPSWVAIESGITYTILWDPNGYWIMSGWTFGGTPINLNQPPNQPIDGWFISGSTQQINFDGSYGSCVLPSPTQTPTPTPQFTPLPTSTPTQSPTPTPFPTPNVPTGTPAPTINTTTLSQCLNGLIIEAIYLGSYEDYYILPCNYVCPCPQTIGGHGCNSANFELYINNTYVGDVLMNNAGVSTSTVTAPNGMLIYQDYQNRYSGWSSTSYSRYSKITIDSTLAQTIVNNSTSNVININSICPTSYCHNDITWIRITSGGTLLYSDCVQQGVVNSLPCNNGTLIPIPILPRCECVTVTRITNNNRNWDIIYTNCNGVYVTDTLFKTNSSKSICMIRGGYITVKLSQNQYGTNLIDYTLTSCNDPSCVCN